MLESIQWHIKHQTPFLSVKMNTQIDIVREFLIAISFLCADSVQANDQVGYIFVQVKLFESLANLALTHAKTLSAVTVDQKDEFNYILNDIYENQPIIQKVFECAGFIAEFLAAQDAMKALDAHIDGLLIYKDEANVSEEEEDQELIDFYNNRFDLIDEYSVKEKDEDEDEGYEIQVVDKDEDYQLFGPESSWYQRRCERLFARQKEEQECRFIVSEFKSKCDPMFKKISELNATEMPSDERLQKQCDAVRDLFQYAMDRRNLIAETPNFRIKIKNGENNFSLFQMLLRKSAQIKDDLECKYDSIRRASKRANVDLRRTKYETVELLKDFQAEFAELYATCLVEPEHIDYVMYY